MSRFRNVFSAGLVNPNGSAVKWILYLTISVALIAGVTITLKNKKHRISYAQFERIQIGMSIKDAEAIFGRGPSDAVSVPGTWSDFHSLEMDEENVYWTNEDNENPNAIILGTDREGRVVTKWYIGEEWEETAFERLGALLKKLYKKCRFYKGRP